MSKLVLWLRIARKYRPLFSLELQWLDLQILPDGHDPNAGGQPLLQQEVKTTRARGLTNPVLGQYVKLGDTWLRRNPTMFGGVGESTYEIVELDYKFRPKALCRMIDDKNKRKLWFDLSDLEPFDYGQDVSD